MNTDEKKTTKNTGSQKASGKVTPIRFRYSESDDPVIDTFILQGMQKEAEEAERRVNEDSKLSKVIPPEGQYEKIVARLKAMGVWEDEQK